jgi:hypothetical protein
VAEGAVHFGVATAGDVEAEALTVLLDHRDLQRVILRPGRQGLLEGDQVGGDDLDRQLSTLRANVKPGLRYVDEMMRATATVRGRADRLS